MTLKDPVQTESPEQSPECSPETVVVGDIGSLMVNRMNEAMVIVQDGLMRMVNDRAAALTGFTRQELTGMPFENVIHPDDRLMVRNYYLRRVAGEPAPNAYQFRGLSKQGQVIWFEIHALAIEFQGRPATLSLLTDITELRRASDASRESRRQYQDLFDHSPMSLFQTSLTGRIISVNKAFADLFGYSSPREAIEAITDLGRDLYAYPEDRRDFLARLLQENKLLNFETSMRKKDGSTVPVRIHARAVRGEDESVQYLEGFIEDRTESNRAVEALARSAEEWRSLFDAVTDPVAILDRDCHIVRANQATLDYFAGEPLNQRYCATKIHMADNRPHDCPAKKTFKTGEPHHLVVGGPEAGGRWYLASAYPIRDPDGTVNRVVHIAHDITEQKAAEQALREAKEAAESANRAKTEFLAVVSHELRTPLNPIIGLTDLLLESDLPAMERGLLETVHGAAGRLLARINDLLEISQIEAGRVQINSGPFEPFGFLEIVCRNPRQAAAEKGLTLNVRSTLPRSCMLEGDHFRLRQILEKLIDNAIKFTDEGGIEVGASMIELTGQNALVRFTVSDTGIGIPPDRIGSLFDRFTQVDASGTRTYGGLGLGLTVADRLARLMGGTIRVENRPERGAAFYVDLPFRYFGDSSMAHPDLTE